MVWVLRGFPNNLFIGEIMKYKEFVDWCNQRACDGCWSSKTAIYCISVMEEVDSHPFWKRNKIWRESFEPIVVEGIIKPIHEKMKKLGII